MLSIPVIAREMLVTARQPLYYRMREAVVGLSIIFMFAVVLNQGGGPDSGLKLYTALHCSVVTMILFFAPALTGDAISRERRDGTLDLLFLTPLTGQSIVSSKLFSNALRMLTIWLACLPIVIIPVLAGGVSPLLIGLSLSVQFICLVLSLLAGLTVSIFVHKALAAVLCSIIAAVLAISAHYIVFCLLLSSPILSPDILLQIYAAIVQVLFFPAVFVQGAFPARSFDLLVFLGGSTLYVFCISLLWAAILGRTLADRRRKEGESARAAWFRRIFLTPAIFKETLRRSMRRKIESNPLIWMEYRTAWSRSARSVLIALLILGESYVLLIDPFSPTFLYCQLITAFIFVFLICVTASSSFQREKENGAFELLLVAPFTEEKLIFGRLGAVWGYYKPAAIIFVIFILASLSGDRLFSIDGLFPLHLLSICLSAISVPVAGLYFALTKKNFLAILTNTAFFTIFVPYFFWDVVQGLLWLARDNIHFFPIGALFGPIVENTTFGIVAVLLLHGALINSFIQRTVFSLRRREFAL